MEPITEMVDEAVIVTWARECLVCNRGSLSHDQILDSFKSWFGKDVNRQQFFTVFGRTDLSKVVVGIEKKQKKRKGKNVAVFAGIGFKDLNCQSGASFNDSSLKEKEIGIKDSENIIELNTSSEVRDSESCLNQSVIRQSRKNVIKSYDQITNEIEYASVTANECFENENEKACNLAIISTEERSPSGCISLSSDDEFSSTSFSDYDTNTNYNSDFNTNYNSNFNTNYTTES